MRRPLRSCLKLPKFLPGRRGFASLRTSTPITKREEENLPDYDPLDFYPVRIGEILASRYKVIGKLGFGNSSTVWLSKDLGNDSFRALKVYIRTAAGRLNHEIEIYKKLVQGDSSHPGKKHVRLMLDTFEINGPHGTHSCLVHEPLWNTLFNLQHRNSQKRFTVDLLRATLRCLLLALDYVHSGCHLIHTDIKATNIMSSIGDESILLDFENAENLNPSKQKATDDRIIYSSRPFGWTKSSFGIPVLCDFGAARDGDVENNDDIQPEVYRAPEVILEMNWSYSVDIWNVGVLIWDLFQNKHLFDALDSDGNYRNEYHLAEMIAYMGPPPLEFLNRSTESWEYFDKQGQLLDAPKLPSSISLESSEENLEGHQKMLFMKFMRKMLCWVPEERKTAIELLRDPWLNNELDNGIGLDYS